MRKWELSELFRVPAFHGLSGGRVGSVQSHGGGADATGDLSQERAAVRIPHSGEFAVLACLVRIEINKLSVITEGQNSDSPPTLFYRQAKTARLF